MYEQYHFQSSNSTFTISKDLTVIKNNHMTSYLFYFPKFMLLGLSSEVPILFSLKIYVGFECRIKFLMILGLTSFGIGEFWYCSFSLFFSYCLYLLKFLQLALSSSILVSSFFKLTLFCLVVRHYLIIAPNLLIFFNKSSISSECDSSSGSIAILTKEFFNPSRNSWVWSNSV